MTTNELRQKYLDFFKSKGHVIVPSSSLIPENDPTVLFTPAGMFPFVPNLMGERHPLGKRLVNCQKCIRTVDIDDVGDNRHLTFFEMLGNWSFGDYFKKEAIEWSFEFLTSKDWLGLEPSRLYVTIFRGDENAPLDEESIKVWQEQFDKVGIKAEVALDGIWKNKNTKIFALPAEDNWWGLASGGPCGPDTEMFYDVAPEIHFEKKSHADLVKAGKLVEVWNDVFVQYNKTPAGKIEELKQKSVDTGMGLERTVVVLNGKKEVFELPEFETLFAKITELSGMRYEDNKKAFRIIADHVRAATFILGDEKRIEPSNVDRGYILRRLIRRAVRYGKQLSISGVFTFKIAEVVISLFGDVYSELKQNKEFIFNQLVKEEEKFAKSLERGLKEFEKIAKNNQITGKQAFMLFSSYGFPLEMTIELAAEKGLKVDVESFQNEFKKHQDLSRTASAGKFKGGLADTSEGTKKLHTAAHLMLQALRIVLGDHVYQKGSNITPERLRFDFSHPEKMTPEQIKKVEDIVNEQIQKDLPVKCDEVTLEEAKKQGAMGVFEHKYGDKVKVYYIGDFSKEICGGPHVNRTGVLGKFKIKKEESSSAGVRRIKAVLE